MDFLFQPWHWSLAGVIIAFVTFLLYYFGRNMGVSSNLETLCAMAGAGKFTDYFKMNWRDRKWNLVFVLGMILGGFVASHYMTPNEKMKLNPKTVQHLQDLGVEDAGEHYLPDLLFSKNQLKNTKVLLVLLIGGILIGFGTRYAGGCTSGHGIVGLASLQKPSFIAVIGFFIGGIAMTWLFLPTILVWLQK